MKFIYKRGVIWRTRDFTFEYIGLEKSWIFHTYLLSVVVGHVNRNRCKPHLLVSCFHRIKGLVLIGVRTSNVYASRPPSLESLIALQTWLR